MISKIKSVLTRKWGPLPAWGWLVIVFSAVYFYRKHSAFSGTGTGSVAPTPGQKQDQVTLQPGESVYDPNTGALTTAPGGGSGDSTASDLATAMDNLANAVGKGAPPTQVNVVYPKPPNPKHKPKTKDPHKKKKVVKHHPPGQHKHQGRSPAKVRSHTGGRTVKRTTGRTVTAPGTGRNKGGKSPRTIIGRGSTHEFPGGKARNKGTHQPQRTPAVRPVVQQRPHATHPAPKAKPPAGPAPRPSAPPPRTHRGRRGR